MAALSNTPIIVLAHRHTSKLAPISSPTILAFPSLSSVSPSKLLHSHLHYGFSVTILPASHYSSTTIAAGPATSQQYSPSKSLFFLSKYAIFIPTPKNDKEQPTKIQFFACQSFSAFFKNSASMRWKPVGFCLPTRRPPKRRSTCCEDEFRLCDRLVSPA